MKIKHLAVLLMLTLITTLGGCGSYMNYQKLEGIRVSPVAEKITVEKNYSLGKERVAIINGQMFKIASSQNRYAEKVVAIPSATFTSPVNCVRKGCEDISGKKGVEYDVKESVRISGKLYYLVEMTKGSNVRMMVDEEGVPYKWHFIRWGKGTGFLLENDLYHDPRLLHFKIHRVARTEKVYIHPTFKLFYLGADDKNIKVAMRDYLDRASEPSSLEKILEFKRNNKTIEFDSFAITVHQADQDRIVYTIDADPEL